MKSLFRTIEELKPHLPAAASVTLAQFAPHLARAQQRFIREALGFDQLTALLDAVAAAAPGAAPDDENLAHLLAQVRPPLASFAAAYYLPSGGATLTGSGTKTSGTEQMKPATATATEGLAEGLRQAGYNGLEMLLEFLEENRASYPLWAASEACTIQAGALLSTAQEFNRYVFIDRSRRRFVELEPSLRDVERLVLAPLMSAELLTELHDQLKAGTTTAPNRTLLSYVRPTLANLAMASDELRQATGQTYLEELRAFLYANAADYPLFTASSVYRPTVSNQLTQDANWGFYAGF